MKEIVYVVKGNFRKQKASIFGVFLLVMIISVFLAVVLSIRQNSDEYQQEEMTRVGFGDLTAWVANVPDTAELVTEVSQSTDVQQVTQQDFIFSEFTVNNQEADTEGQLLVYNQRTNQYKFFENSLSSYTESPAMVTEGEIYVSASLASLYGVQIGDEIYFPTVRQSEPVRFVIRGFFEDPFMGSSMIGMKSFLINENDWQTISNQILLANEDAIARNGAMLHIFKEAESSFSNSEFNQHINEETTITNYSEFVHTDSAIAGFMLILQNIFSGILMIFVVILVLVTVFVLSYSISSSIEQSFVDLGILKSLGFTSEKLRYIQLITYFTGILAGMGLGFLSAVLLVPLVNQTMVTTTGLLLPNDLPILLIVGAYLMLLLFFGIFISLKTARIKRIEPIVAMTNGREFREIKKRRVNKIRKERLFSSLALRQLLTDKKQYFSVGLIALLLVFFVSLVFRINSWLGPNGEGMMDAFNPADLDIGVERLGDISEEDVEGIINQTTGISDQYELAMPGITINGIDHTANVITAPEQFHILEGRTIENADEIVVTEFVAANLNVEIGDSIEIGFEDTLSSYEIVGIYQCANELGNNIGMSQAGFYRIGSDEQLLWCTHYFLENSESRTAVINNLQNTFGGDVHVHENSWSGLNGIISAMSLLTSFMYIVVVVFSLIVVVITGTKILFKEQIDMGIYKAFGFTTTKLRLSFSYRFLFASLIGSLVGVAFSQVCTDLVVSSLFRMSGISNFHSELTAIEMVIPLVFVVFVFWLFAYLVSRRVKNVAPTGLMS